jgi:hypothetical protein
MLVGKKRVAVPLCSAAAPNKRPALCAPSMSARMRAKGVIYSFFKDHVLRSRTKDIAQRFCDCCITLEESETSNLYSMNWRIRQAVVIAATQNMLTRILLLTRQGKEGILVGGVHPNVILAGFLLAVFPLEIFGEDESKEAIALQRASRPFIELLEATALLLSKGWTWRMTFQNVGRQLMTALTAYVMAFRCWNIPKEARVLAKLRDDVTRLQENETLLPLGQTPERGYNQWKLKAVQRHIVQASRADFVFGSRRYAMLGGTAPSMGNEQLCQEILLNSAYNFGSQTKNPCGFTVKERFTPAFYATMLDELLQTPPIYMKAGILFKALRSTVLVAVHCPNVSSAVEAGVKYLVEQPLLDNRVGAVFFEGVIGVLLAQSLDEVDAKTKYADIKSKWESVQARLFFSTTTDYRTRVVALVESFKVITDLTIKSEINYVQGAMKKLVVKLDGRAGVRYLHHIFKENVAQGLDVRHVYPWINGSMSDLHRDKDPRLCLDKIIDGKLNYFKVNHHANHHANHHVNISSGLNVNLVYRHPCTSPWSTSSAMLERTPRACQRLCYWTGIAY